MGGGGAPEYTVTKAIKPERIMQALSRNPDTKVLIKSTLRPLAMVRAIHRAMMVGTLRTNSKPPIVGIRIPKAPKSPLSMPVELEFPVQLEIPVQFSIPHRDIQQNTLICRHVHKRI